MWKISAIGTNRNTDIAFEGRNSTIDIARGIAILLVIIQHCGAFGQFILSFHMPLFFIISGLVVKNGKPKNSFFEEVRDNVKNLLIPQVMLGLFECVFLIIIGIHETHSFQLLTMSEIFNAIFRWWFLLVLFQCRLLIWLFRRFLISNKWYQVAFLCVLFAGTIVVEKVPDHFYGTFMYPQLVPISTLFILIGYYLRGILLSDKTCMGGGILLITITLTIVFAFLNNKVLMYRADFGNILLFLISAVMGSFVVIRISGNIKSSFLQWLGMMSMPIYIFQFHLNQYSSILINKIFGNEVIQIRVALIIFVSLCGCLSLTYLVSKFSRISFLFGIRKRVDIHTV